MVERKIKIKIKRWTSKGLKITDHFGEKKFATTVLEQREIDGRNGIRWNWLGMSCHVDMRFPRVPSAVKCKYCLVE